MDEQSNDALQQILQKLDALESQIGAVNDRVARLESGGAAAPTHQPPAPAAPVPAAPPPLAAAPQPTPHTTQDQIHPDHTHGDEPGVEFNAELPESPPSRPVTRIDEILKQRPESIPGTAPEKLPPPSKPATHPPESSGMLELLARKNAARASSAGMSPRGESLEMAIAGTWLPRIGVLLLALVLVLVAREHVHGPVGKVIGAYLLAIALIAAGLFYERRYPRWSGPVIAGGLAFSYFASYAMGFVEPMRLLDSLAVKLAVLGSNLFIIFGFAQWKKSETMAGTALILGYLTTGVVGRQVAALYSCIALSTVAVLFLWKNRWLVSTAFAVTASYGAWFYIQHAIPPDNLTSAAADLWQHATALTLLFVIFCFAEWLALQTIHNAGIATLSSSSLLSRYTLGQREQLLATLAQTNIVGYVAAMTWALRSTQIYWTHAWIYYGVMVAACAGMTALTWRNLSLRAIHLCAAAISLAFAIMSASTPAWMPVLLATQALAMLLASRNRSLPRIWAGLSLLLIAYALGYLFENRASPVDPSATHALAFPPGIWLVTAALAAAYSAIWEQHYARPYPASHFNWAAAFGLMGAAAVAWGIWARQDTAPWLKLLVAAGAPAAVIASSLWRIASPFAFVCVAGLGSILLFAQDPVLASHNGWIAGVFAVAALGVSAGLVAERTWDGKSKTPRLNWRAIYLWVQYLVCMVAWVYGGRSAGALFTIILIAGSIALAWQVRSAALAKSAYVPVFILGLWLIIASPEGNINWLFAALPFGLLAATWPLGYYAWTQRTGDQHPGATLVLQLLIMIIAGSLCIKSVAALQLSVPAIFTAAAWAIILLAMAAAGIFTTAIIGGIVFAILSGLLIMAAFFDETATARIPGLLTKVYNLSPMIWALAAIALLITGERLLHWRTRNLYQDDESRVTLPWPSALQMRRITTAIAVSTLILTAMALRLWPELRVFYYTGAIVAAAFIWVVLGFSFQDPVYRQAGLFLLCAGIVKGLVWDVLSLKNTLYRQISWTVLGVLAIGASFLYNRFRNRVEDEP